MAISTIKAQRLEKLARDAVTQYNKDLAGGGEPVFPDWAVDLLALLDFQDTALLLMRRLVTAHEISQADHTDGEEKVYTDARKIVYAVGY